MTIRARIHTSGAITVHEYPNIIARLFGARQSDYECEWTGCTWSNADTGRMVSHAAHKAIERALTERAVERRLIERLAGR